MACPTDSFSDTGSTAPDGAPSAQPVEGSMSALMRQYDVPAAEREEAFRRLVVLATHLFDAPVAVLELGPATDPYLLSSVGGEVPFQNGAEALEHGLPFPECPLQTGNSVVIENLAVHETFGEHPLVTGEDDRLRSDAALQFYAGAPLTTAEGHPVGTISILDTEPRSPSTGTVKQLDGLADMAAEAVERHRTAPAERMVDASPLREEHDLLKSLFRASAAAITVLDPKGQVVRANARAEEVLGLPPNDVEGRAYDDPHWEHQTADGRSLPDADLPFVQVMEKEAPVYDVRHAIAGPSDERRVLSTSGAPLHDADGTLGGGVFISNDVTERVRYEHALQEDRDRFETLFEGLPTPVVSGIPRDGQFEVQAINSAFETVFGFDAGEIEGRDLHSLIVPVGHRDRAVEIDQMVLAENGALQTEVRRIAAEGPRNFHMQVAARTRPDGPPELYAIYTDITDRREMEETLREREALLRSITDHISDGIYRSDPEQGILYANEAFVRMFGYDNLGEVREVEASALYARPDERERLLRVDEEEGEIDQVEVEFERKDGTTFVGLLSSRAVRDETGTVRYHDGVVTDITDRKAYEEQLAYRYELEREIVDVSTRFINTPREAIDEAIEEALGAVGSLVDADRSYVFLVDEDEQTVSNTHEWCAEGIAPHKPSLQSIPYDAMPWFLERIHRQEPLITATADLPPAASGLRAFLDEGNIESLVVLPMTQGENLVGFVGYDGVEAEREWETDTVIILRVLSDAIANALQRKEMEEKMVAAKQEAEEANRLKSAFLANMSHEIRTPLTSIIGFAEAIGDEVETLAQEAEAVEIGSLDRFANLIERSGRRLLETLNAVLNLSKLEAGEMDLEVERIDLAEEVREIVELQATQAEAAGIDLQLEERTASAKESGPVWARADAGGLRIVLRNLVSNAIKYTEEGGEVRVRAWPDADASVLEVEDTGIGMEPEEVPKIFNAFEQSSAGAKRSFEGIGLGLAVTKRLVDQMDGTIEVETEKDVGSCFTVRLPKAPDGQKKSG